MDLTDSSVPRGGRGAGRSAAHRDRRRKQLIDAALGCIASLGLRDTTVQDVARRAGMAVGSISQYFNSKEALYTAVLNSLSEEFAAAWQRGLEGAGPAPAARLRCFVQTYFEKSICQRRKIAVWFAFWGEVRARPHYRKVCAVYDRHHDETLASLCAAMRDGQNGTSLEPQGAACLVAAMCQGLWLEFLTGDRGLGRDELARLADRNLAALFPAAANAIVSR
ncbi:MAG: TetR family transcriptional regulator C-terminal domain-containing protein [Steroidobacteraceae bacterium]